MATFVHIGTLFGTGTSHFYRIAAMNEKRNLHIRAQVYMPVILAMVLVLGFFLGVNLRRPGAGTNDQPFFSVGVERNDKLNHVVNYILDSYVDPVSREDLTESTIRSLLQNLDPHSSYIPAAEFRRMNDPLMGSFEGIGIEFNMISDTLVVINPIAGGPSEEAGIMPGDRFIFVGDTLIAGVNKSTDEVVDMLMGEKGTTVEVQVKRTGLPELLSFSLTRDKIPSFSLDIAYMADERTGYIRLNKFSATTYQEFIEGVDELKEQGMEQMILDLRGNGGGFLDAAIEVSEELLRPGELIVYTDGRRRPRNYARSERAGRFGTQPLIVLIDEWSASASEIIAGAVQDNDRGLVAGRRSFGKGLVQEQMQLGDGSAMRLTVARYYTPTGRSIQKPYDEGEEAYFSEFLQRYHNGELISPDSIYFDDSLRFETPGGRTVYGGGGIMPDIFVPLQTDNDIGFFNRVFNRGHIYTFAFDYSDRHRASLENYGSAERYTREFSISREIFHSFLEYAGGHGSHAPENLSPEAEKLIKTNLKAYIGRNIFGPKAFYPVLHKSDRTFLKAMDAFEGEEMQLLKESADL